MKENPITFERLQKMRWELLNASTAPGMPAAISTQDAFDLVEEVDRLRAALYHIATAPLADTQMIAHATQALGGQFMEIGNEHP
jgi:hypothetical protein